MTAGYRSSAESVTPAVALSGKLHRRFQDGMIGWSGTKEAVPPVPGDNLGRFFIHTARGNLDVTIEVGPPFLEQDGIKLHRSIVHEEFSGDMVGKPEAHDEGKHFYVLEYEYR